MCICVSRAATGEWCDSGGSGDDRCVSIESTISLAGSTRREGSRECMVLLGVIMAAALFPPTPFAVMHNVNRVYQIVLSPFRKNTFDYFQGNWVKGLWYVVVNDTERLHDLRQLCKIDFT